MNLASFRRFSDLAALRGKKRFAASVALMALVLLAAVWIRFRLIHESMPYCRHIDERTWSQIAMRMVLDGDLNPKRFTKPSLPVYTMSTGFALGLVRAASRGEARMPKQLGTDAFPYYQLPTAAEVPRALFALLSVGAMGFAGVIAYRLRRDERLLWLTPLIAGLSYAYMEQSWTYLNVDIFGAFFALATVTYLIVEHTTSPAGAASLRRAALGGVLCGLTIGSKYNLYPILLPCLFYAVLFTRERLVSRLVVLGITTVGTFLATTPYAVLDLFRFVRDVTAEVAHYATHHKGVALPPGLPMLRLYLGDLAFSYGWLPLLVSVAGGWVIAKRDWRLALVVLSFPVALLAYMCKQRVFFARNTVSLHLFVAVLLAVALVELPRWLEAASARFRPLASRPARVRRATAFAVLALILLVGVPWRNVASAFPRSVESRNTVTRWIETNVPKGSKIVVDSLLLMNTSPLEEHYDIQVLELTGESQGDAIRFRDDHRGVIAIIPAMDEPFRRALADGSAKVLARFGLWSTYRKVGAIEGDPKLTVLEL